MWRRTISSRTHVVLPKEAKRKHQNIQGYLTVRSVGEQWTSPDFSRRPRRENKRKYSSHWREREWKIVWNADMFSCRWSGRTCVNTIFFWPRKRQEKNWLIEESISSAIFHFKQVRITRSFVGGFVSNCRTMINGWKTFLPHKVEWKSWKTRNFKNAI